MGTAAGVIENDQPSLKGFTPHTILQYHDLHKAYIQVSCCAPKEQSAQIIGSSCGNLGPPTPQVDLDYSRALSDFIAAKCIAILMVKNQKACACTIYFYLSASAPPAAALALLGSAVGAIPEMGLPLSGGGVARHTPALPSHTIITITSIELRSRLFPRGEQQHYLVAQAGSTDLADCSLTAEMKNCSACWRRQMPLPSPAPLRKGEAPHRRPGSAALTRPAPVVARQESCQV